MSMIMQDNVIYDELRGVEPATAISAGDVAVVQDVFGFYLADRVASGDEICFVYRCRQVLATKLTGTGEAIVAGDRLYYNVSEGKVSASKPAGGTYGTDYYFCGWAKDDAAASATTVLMNFDGTRYNENL